MIQNRYPATTSQSSSRIDQAENVRPTHHRMAITVT
jgi:hypothetical protein